jgi:hypothetical protein
MGTIGVAHLGAGLGCPAAGGAGCCANTVVQTIPTGTTHFPSESIVRRRDMKASISVIRDRD